MPDINPTRKNKKLHINLTIYIPPFEYTYNKNIKIMRIAIRTYTHLFETVSFSSSSFFIAGLNESAICEALPFSCIVRSSLEDESIDF